MIDLNRVYAVYRGDEFVTIGTREEIMKEFNMALSSFYFYTSKGNIVKYDNRKLKHKPSNRYIIIKIEEEEHEIG